MLVNNFFILFLSIAVCRNQLDYNTSCRTICQHFFDFFKSWFITERRRRDLNPRAAVNDLHPFQGCPFGQLGYFSEYIIVFYLCSLKTSNSIVIFKERRGWDSNPCALADKRFSRPPRYDHFDTSPYVLFLHLNQRKTYTTIIAT